LRKIYELWAAQRVEGVAWLSIPGKAQVPERDGYDFETSERKIAMQLNKRVTRGVAVLTGGVLAASALFHPAPASAADKSKTYKAGAVALGAASAYFILKGKTVPAAVAGAGAYYAYKKGKEAENDDYYGRYDERYRYDDRYDYSNRDDYYSRYPNDPRYPDDYYSRYPDRGTYPGDYGYRVAPQANTSDVRPVLK
jgi:hypothetical protein